MNQGSSKEIARSLGSLLDGGAPTAEEMAEEATLSRFHYQRVFKRIMGETPGELRRRILLERAAYLLVNGKASITEIAFDCGFESLEGFTRAFRKGHGCSPSEFRSGPVRGYALRSPNDVHFAAYGSFMPGGNGMDFLDRLLEQDAWMMKNLLAEAGKLTEEELDRRVVASQAVNWDGDQSSIRNLLDRIIFTREVWVAAVNNEGVPEELDKTPLGLARRYEVSQSIFAGFARRVRDQGQWDTTFVDELCDPPETFTFAGMIEHVLTFSIHRRTLAFEAMRALGHDIGYGEPIEWERLRMQPSG